MRNERQVTNSQRNALAAHFGENPLTGRYMIFVDVAHCDRRLRSRRKAAGRGQADGVRRNLIRVEVGAAPHRRAILDLQSDTAARRALGKLPQNGPCTEKSAHTRPADATDSWNRPFK